MSRAGDDQPWSGTVVSKVADVLGATDTGLTGPEIEDLLARLAIPDPGRITKRYRITRALREHQATTGSSKCVRQFIVDAMQPVRYTDRPGLRARRSDALDEVLVFVGLRVLDDGRLGRGARAATLSEAAVYANTVRAELRRRGTHADVLRYCTDELLARDAFHAQLEASKSVFDKLRVRTGLTGDGAALVDAALSGTAPPLRINDFVSTTDESEQKGFANLVKGVAGLFRNPVAHDPRLQRSISDDELLEVLTTLSMIHRRLDDAQVVP